jgi:hypothetical protein
VAEGDVLGAVVIDAHPAMRRNVRLATAELMKLVFMGFEGFDWFLQGGINGWS